MTKREIELGLELEKALSRIWELEAALRVARLRIDPDLISDADYALVNAALAPEQGK
jgi:hypothetical protein